MSEDCRECGNYQRCKYFLKCASDTPHLDKCPGFFIEKPFVKIEMQINKVSDGVKKNVSKSKKSNSNRRDRMERGLYFLQ